MDYSKLKGRDLFYYMTTCIEDKDYSSVISLLPYAVPEIEKAYELLEKAVRDGKKFIAVYPGINEQPTPEMKLIGSIPDGGLYLM